MNKSLATAIHSVSKVKFNFRTQHKLLPQIKGSNIFRVKSSIIRIDSNITNNIMRLIMYCRKMVGLRSLSGSSGINRSLFRRPPIYNNMGLSITEKWSNKNEKLIGTSRRLHFVKKASMLNTVKRLWYITYYSSSSKTCLKTW